MIWAFWISVLFLAYTFAGYPVLVWLLARMRNRSHQRAPYWPTVTIIIPAHNEARLLLSKIVNTLELNYPADKLEIMVASDGSEDDTPEIVRSFATRGVKLVESRVREGKHHVQMLARDASHGEILVFTDTSVHLDREVLQRVTSNFADPAVACVSSEDRVADQKSHSDEGSYVGFEMWLRRMEARAGSLVSVSGSFFAARREICDVWHPHQSSDFFVPLHAAARRRRVVVDPKCVGYYGVTRKEGAEFQRKVRTIVHGLDVFFTHLRLLNPFRYRLFSLQLASHKLFRWMVPFSMLGVLISSFFLWNHGTFYQLTLIAQIVLYVVGVAGLVLQPLLRFKPVKIASFFLLGNAATLVAWLKFVSGEKFVYWRPTERGVETGAAIASAEPPQ
jgi:glycosyltransferase involved in cell wall biosynthesis